MRKGQARLYNRPGKMQNQSIDFETDLMQNNFYKME